MAVTVVKVVPNVQGSGTAHADDLGHDKPTRSPSRGNVIHMPNSARSNMRMIMRVFA
jgi:hypothetical protein